MRILFLGYEGNPLISYLKEIGEEVKVFSERLTPTILGVINPDFIISYGYRHILKRDVLAKYPNRVINLHISYLPWNRGADPNFWSFLENTPKGVTIHYVDEGIDTGDIIAQKEVFFNHDETLKTSYNKLQEALIALFKDNWTNIKSGNVSRIKQVHAGTSHKTKDKELFRHILRKGFDTPAAEIMQYGNENGLWIAR